MTKKVINQKSKFDEKLINTIEPNFIFKDKPINRFNVIENSHASNQKNKAMLIQELKETKSGEREGRAQDKETADMMQKLRALGYM